MKTPQQVESVSRRSVLRAGVLAGVGLAGITVTGGTARAGHPRTLDVDVIPTINPRSKGRIPAKVLRSSDPTPAEVLADPDFTGFKLGPRGSTVDANGADAVHWQLKGNGDLVVQFDPQTANIWFDSDDDEAVLSAPNVAWGVDSVRVK